MKVFITFGNKAYNQTKKRLVREVKKLEVFEKVISYGPENFNDEFKNKHMDFINNNPRGYGYFIWKPYFICETLKLLKENDILVYADAGCKIYPQFKKRLLEYFGLIEQNNFGLLNFQLKSLEYEYTKSDLAERLEVLNNKKIMNTNQIAGGIQIMRKCDHSQMIMNKWLQIMEENYHLIDDTPSKTQNHKYFKEHRHDQSVISILVKKYGSIIIPDETYPPGIGPISADRIKNSRLSFLKSFIKK